MEIRMLHPNEVQRTKPDNDHSHLFLKLWRYVSGASPARSNGPFDAETVMRLSFPVQSTSMKVVQTHQSFDSQNHQFANEEEYWRHGRLLWIQDSTTRVILMFNDTVYNSSLFETDHSISLSEPGVIEIPIEKPFRMRWVIEEVDTFHDGKNLLSIVLVQSLAQSFHNAASTPIHLVFVIISFALVRCYQEGILFWQFDGRRFFSSLGNKKEQQFTRYNGSNPCGTKGESSQTSFYCETPRRR
jgi:hypothetical protein